MFELNFANSAFGWSLALTLTPNESLPVLCLYFSLVLPPTWRSILLLFCQILPNISSFRASSVFRDIPRQDM